ncbi:MAG: hypothetical protein ACT4P7_04200 [Gemmatimonadaceae bacterium]
MAVLGLWLLGTVLVEGLLIWLVVCWLARQFDVAPRRRLRDVLRAGFRWPFALGPRRRVH